MKKRIVYSVLLAFGFQSVFAGNVFYWQGTFNVVDWRQWNDPANWSLNRDSYENDDSLVPGAEDEIWGYGKGATSAASVSSKFGYFDLGGAECSFTGYSNGSGAGVAWKAYQLVVSNGVLRVKNVNSLSGNTHGYDVFANTTVILEQGTATPEFQTSWSGLTEKWNVRSGGRMEVYRQNMLLLNLSVLVEDGGHFIWEPGKLGLYEGGNGSVVDNYGIMEFPIGLNVNNWRFSSQGRAKTLSVRQNAGRMVFGGNFTKSVVEDLSPATMSFELAGGTLVASNNVAFLASSVQDEVQATMTGDATVEVLQDSTLDMGLFTFEAGKRLAKTGSGVLRLTGRVPDILDVQSGPVTIYGDSTLQMLQTSGTGSLCVDGGTVHVLRAPCPEFNKDASFHFDASDLSSFDYELSDNSVTNVLKWYDTRTEYRETRYAQQPQAERMTYIKAKPTLKTVPVTDDSQMAVVDFGGISTSATTDETSAGLQMFWRTPTEVREVHAVLRPNNSGTAGQGPSLFTSASYTHYLRDGWTEKAFGKFSFFADDSTTKADATGWVDAVPTKPSEMTMSDTTSFRLFSISVADRDTHVDTMCVERNSSAGGLAIAEMIGFSAQLEDEVRTYMMASLMHKWLGAPMPVWTENLATLVLTNSAALVLPEDYALSVDAFVGTGTVTTPKLSVGSTLTLDGPLTVNGALKLGDENVVITIRSGFDFRVSGIYPIVSATELDDLDLSKVTLVAAPRKLGRMRLLVQENQICIKYDQPGTVLIVR